MTTKPNVKALLKRARRASEPFSVMLGDVELAGTFTALPFMRWEELIESHPARDGNDADAGWGFNHVTAFPAAVRACMSDPVMDDEDWDAFCDLLSEGDMVRLGLQAYTLNERRNEVGAGPKSLSTSPEATPPSSG